MFSTGKKGFIHRVKSNVYLWVCVLYLNRSDSVIATNPPLSRVIVYILTVRPCVSGWVILETVPCLLGQILTRWYILKRGFVIIIV